MPTGDKDRYTDKEKRQAEHIEEGYESRGVSKEEAERRAWATVNAVHGGGEKPGGGGYGKPENHEPMRRGGEIHPRMARSRNGAARKNVRKAASAARRKRTIAHLPKATRTALAKKGASARKKK